jgi:dTDP-4-dehydrorhamnose reductase
MLVIGRGNHHLHSPVVGNIKYLESDISESEIYKILVSTKPELVINAAAISDIDACAKNPVDAYRVNSTLPEILSKFSQDFNYKLIHLSTDAILKNINDDLIKEEAEYLETSVYSKSKILAERSVLKMSPDFLILRFRPLGHDLKNRNLFDFFSKNLSESRKVEAFTNVKFTPIFVSEFSRIVKELISLNRVGIYHVSDSKTYSKSAIAMLISSYFSNSDGLVLPKLYTSFSKANERLLNTSLDGSKLSSEGIAVEPVEDSIHRYMKALGRKN